MRAFQDLWFRVKALFGSRRMDQEFTEELRFHLEMETRELIQKGLAPEEARRRALVALGGVDRYREEARDARGARCVEDCVRDLRYGFRALRRSPVFTAVAVLSLGLGIGANTAIFSMVDAVLLRSLPVPDPQDLRVLNWTGLDARINISGSYSQPEGGRLGVGDAVSFSVFRAVEEEASAYAEVFCHARLNEVTVQLPGSSFVADGLMVSGNFFEGLGVGASLGRVFTEGDSEAETEGWVVVSHDWWQGRLGGEANALGQTVLLNGHAFTVIGVLPPGVQGLYTGDRVDFYVSLAAQPALMPSWDRTAENRWWLVMMARLAPGTEEGRFGAVAEAAFQNATEGLVEEAGLLIYDGWRGLTGWSKQLRRPLMILLGIVGAVILVACANLAGLSLARGLAREHELAVRPALGASRGRLLRQALTESLLLSFLGAGVGIGVAFWGKAVVAPLLFNSFEELHYLTTLDLRVLAFTVSLALLSGVLSGILPAMKASRVDPLLGLRERGERGSPRLRAGRVLIVGQVALSVVLLIGAGLYGRTLYNLVRIDPGFETERLLLFRLNPRSAGWDDGRETGFYDDVTRALASIPGVRSVTVSHYALLTGWMSGGGFFTLPDHPRDDETRPTAHRHTVSETYFETMGIPIVLGRGLEGTDVEGAAKVAVVNETFVRRYLEEGSPIGERLHAEGADWTIVGVSRDALYTGITDDIAPTVYFSFRQSPLPAAFFGIRTSVPPLSILDAARVAVASVDPRVPLARVETQLQVRDRRIAQERLFAYLCAALAGLAVLLSCIGLYGLMAYNVTRRRGEIGIRVALGATRGQIARPILVEALSLTALGVVLGVPMSLWAVQLTRSQLYGVEPSDPASLIGGVGSLLLVALFAAWAPAHRASRVDPASSLQAD